MKHKSKNGKVYEIGEVKEYKGNKTYDIILIMDWESGENVKIVNFYFGNYDYEITEVYIKQNN